MTQSTKRVTRLEVLRLHRKPQRELMMENRTKYKDHGLLFAKEWGDIREREECLGQPLQMNNLGPRTRGEP